MNMENFDDVIFDDDEFGELASEQEKQEGTEDTLPATQQQPSSQEQEDLTTEVLKLKGISNPEKIKFEDETGAIIERAWDSLTREEQINILIDQEQEQQEFDDSELQLINTIRESGMTPEEYLQSLVPEVEQIKRYKVDDLSDEEVYALDLLHKVGQDISDEEINQAIELAKQNEGLFKKTVEGLRKEYIRLQENEEAQIANEKAAKEEEAYNKFATSIKSQIQGLDSFAGQPLQLSDDDIEDLSSFMLELDDQGLSAFGRAMNDPSLFTRAAFWILNEDKIVEELNQQIQDNYRRGYEQAKMDLQGKPKLVFNKPTSQKKTTDDVFIDDEDW